MIGPLEAHERLGNYLDDSYGRRPWWKHYAALAVWLVTGALFWLALALLAFGAVFAILLAIAKPIAEASCNQRADQLHVVDADFRLLSGTCYLMLESGETIPADQYRATEAVER